MIRIPVALALAVASAAAGQPAPLPPVPPPLDAPAAPDTPPGATVQSYGEGRADCAEWSDGCVVCRRDARETACSTPGVACTPTGAACRRPK